ncbi:MAG: hypothetical protein ISS43_01915 [Candidatus Omnitrophica bacterium]|nr:hypothetical protein [Candidatus Omnitrophota bacterium]
MNPALPKTRIDIQKGRGKHIKEMQKQFSKAKIGLGIATKGRTGLI